jgi:hypothetical protein
MVIYHLQNIHERCALGTRFCSSNHFSAKAASSAQFIRQLTRNVSRKFCEIEYSDAYCHLSFLPINVKASQLYVVLSKRS